MQRTDAPRGANILSGLLTLAASVSFGIASLPAAAQTYAGKTVNATDSIEAAAQATLPSGATSPTAYAVTPGGTLTFSGVTGSVTFNNGNFNDADGVGSVSDTSVNAANGISSIAHLSKAGYLIGLFTGTAAPSGTAPAGLTFSDPGNATGVNTNFATLSPLLSQTFFIGDGLTGDGTGTAQKFFVPTGATKLYLGFADAPGYHGDPGSYGDNFGTLTASFTVTPEPSQSAALGLGVLGLMGLAVKARKCHRTVA